MGVKTRSNYKPGLCMKFDCDNRNDKCKECIKFSEYKKKDKK